MGKKIDISWRKVRGRKIKTSKLKNGAIKDSSKNEQSLEKLLEEFKNDSYLKDIELAEEISLRTGKDFFDVFSGLRDLKHLKEAKK